MPRVKIPVSGVLDPVKLADLMMELSKFRINSARVSDNSCIVVVSDNFRDISEFAVLKLYVDERTVDISSTCVTSDPVPSLDHIEDYLSDNLGEPVNINELYRVAEHFKKMFGIDLIHGLMTGITIDDRQRRTMLYYVSTTRSRGKKIDKLYVFLRGKYREVTVIGTYIFYADTVYPRRYLKMLQILSKYLDVQLDELKVM